ncbi:NAD(P)/FAD-dependent oxidoreductase [Methanolacinia paynteri]|uniref:NAD(P)/FAD-dependent oxidoreductase n=1 Tax=Methanolacinia paynteri TaxID=230356 RepID=UPI00064F2947|nr:NAD(P)/FAD-dependent oxidoreductase [Methanolacinia paynteri]
MKNEYDVLVIGGGPGGALAAKVAAGSGLSVCIVEKRPAIGTPVRCAEGIEASVLPEFFNEMDPKWISAKIRRAKIVAPDGSSFYLRPAVSGDEVGYILDRKFFDRDLVRQAVDAGAECYIKARAVNAIVEDGYLKGAVLEYGGERSEVRAKVVIAADGVESKFSRYCGIDSTVPLNGIKTCAQYLMTDIDIEPGVIVFSVGRDAAPEGYAWIFPKGERSANVGVCIPGNRSGDGKRARDYLDKYVAEHFPEGKALELMTGGIPVCEPLECTVANGLIVVGDAARLSYPFSGGGIYNAMYSGKLAGEIAVECIAKNDWSRSALMKYDKTWRESKLGGVIRHSYQIKEIFVKLDDNQLNAILNSISNIIVKELSTFSLVRELVKLDPGIFSPKILKDLAWLKNNALNL